jgi:hypothetical protein
VERKPNSDGERLSSVCAASGPRFVRSRLAIEQGECAVSRSVTSGHPPGVTGQEGGMRNVAQTRGMQRDGDDRTVRRASACGQFGSMLIRSWLRCVQ